MIVLELNINDQFTILGTSIMLANVLQEQDPMNFIEDSTITDQDIIERHNHYISQGYPDQRWIYINVSLNKDTPLMENPCAPLVMISEINSPVTCNNIILATLVGYNEKVYLSFNMDKETLETAIKEYFEKPKDIEEEKHFIETNQIHQKLLKK